MLEPVASLGPYVEGDVVVGPFEVPFLDENGDPVDLTGVAPDVLLVFPDGTQEAATAVVSADGTTVDVTLSGTTFVQDGVYRLEFRMTQAGNTVSTRPVEFVVDNITQGWPTLEQVRARWRDAPASDVYLWALLDVARQQVLAWGPAAIADAIRLGTIPVPTNYVAARITQARNIWNAVKTDPSTGAIGDEGFLIRPFPLDWTVKQMIRPKRAKPTIESRLDPIDPNALRRWHP